jgi:hypothetical protein
MDRMNPRIPQAYGYAVCFIAVIVMLISIKSVVDAAFDLSDPIRAEAGRMGRSLTNFELYKIEAKQQQGPPRGTVVAPIKAEPDTLSTDAELRKAYDAEREAAIGNARFRSMRSLVGSLLLILVSFGLFMVHWRWLRQRDLSATAAA